MISRKMKLLSATVAAVALIATLALARTVHMQAGPAHQASGSNGKVIGASPGQNIPFQQHGIMACGTDITVSDCEKLKMMLPI
jgi:hypothetical protein